MYAIRRTFPNGKILGDGLVRTGTRSDTVLTFRTFDEAQEAADRFNTNSPYTFDVVGTKFYSIADRTQVSGWWQTTSEDVAADAVRAGQYVTVTDESGATREYTLEVAR